MREFFLLILSLSTLFSPAMATPKPLLVGGPINITGGWLAGPESPAENVTLKWFQDDQHLRWLSARALSSDCPVSSMHNPFRPAMMGNWTQDGSSSIGVYKAQDACPRSSIRKFRAKPLAAQQWWDRQKRTDRHGGGHGRTCDPRPPSPPRFISYICCDSDQGPGLPDINGFKGINVIIISFLEINGPGGKLADFFKAPVKQRHEWIKALHERGISVMLSAFGGDASQQAITMKYDPVALGKLHGEIVVEAGFDGLDNDIEDFQASMEQNHDASQWIIEYTRAVRSKIPQDKYALSTAPIVPWFTTNTKRYCSGLFREVNKEVGELYSWYNLQFYNQGDDEYNDCNSIFFKSNYDSYEGTSIFEIHKENNIPLDKLVVGKPASREDADTGYIAPLKLSKCISQAHRSGWNAGVMAWQWPNANSEWFRKVRGKTYPITKTVVKPKA